MTLIRAKISEAHRRHIIAMSGGRCNKCRCQLFLENQFGEKARLGDDAHIVAASEVGPRGKSDLNPQERALASNLLLLCKNCHAAVDQQPEQYPVTDLLQMREQHYSWVEECFNTTLQKQPKFHYLSYVNVPRADMYAAANSISLPSVSFGNANSIGELGMGAGRLMAGYVGVLNREELYANEFLPCTSLSDLSVGSYWFSDEAQFRSKKVRRTYADDIPSAWKEQECVIYRKFKNWRLVCMIDPRWITTATAYVTLSSGNFLSVGLMHISELDYENGIAWASPVFLGAPDKGFSI